MKKIFTFLFFATIMTGAMAQGGRNGQHQDQQGSIYQSNGYSGNSQTFGQSNNGYTQPKQDNGGFNTNNGYQQNNSHSYDQSFNHGNEYGNERRGDEQRFDNRFDHHDYGYDNRKEYERFNHRRFQPKVFIRFGHPYRF